MTDKKLDLQAIRKRAEAATEHWDEEWRKIDGTKGLYEVSNMGNVRSKLKPGNHRNKVGNARLLKLRKDKRGYYSISLPLGKNGGYVNRMVHRLAAEAFIGKLPKGKETAHLNGDSTDNRAENLAYVTRIENEAHKKLHGTSPVGENNGQAKLLGWQVSIAKYLIKKGIPQVNIARMFEWDSRTVSEIALGDRWVHVDPYKDVVELLGEVDRLRTDNAKLVAELERADKFADKLESHLRVYQTAGFIQDVERLTKALRTLTSEEDE